MSAHFCKSQEFNYYFPSAYCKPGTVLVPGKPRGSPNTALTQMALE